MSMDEVLNKLTDKIKQGEKMNEAKIQYNQYVKAYARERGITIETARTHKICEEYRKYCEEVFGCKILEDKGGMDKVQEITL